MADSVDDRFAHITSDPRFRTLRKADKRVKVDKRFSKMFTEKKFTLKYSVDKRGKRTNKKEEDLNKFYDLSDSETERPKQSLDQESDQGINSESLEPIEKPKIPNARGVDTEEESELSSSSESEDSEGETEELIHEWNEFDKDVPKTETFSKRLAICNLDWDRISARDLLVLVNSFKPSDGSILSVKIYPSEFGKERMKVESESGPIPFLKCAKRGEDNEEEKDIEDPKLKEELRKYELTRLRYFYAVVECDTALTAEVLYNELDGMEYESSSTALDLRFIDDDIVFDDQPKSECHSMPDMSSYKAPQFINTALQQSKVQMTWDQTDPKRRDIFERAFRKEDEDDDLKAYLATSSEEDEEEENVDFGENDGLSTKDKINKYKNLLNSLDEPKEDNNEGNMEMEISWEPNLKDVTEDIVSRKRSEKDISAFEHDHMKMKEKRRQSKKDMNAEEESEEEKVEAIASKINKNKRKLKQQNEEKDPNLELLVMDDNEESDKRHFNYKSIVENKTKSKSSDSFKVSFIFV